ncbi:Manganese transport system membrane protein MntB [Pirellulimonas nuda]|uniref:Manganese transport system membrane protein MntB n=1 Tax=Pirellulimonas nuda TaxID=2528009 RepID=A0A518DEM7_9BACT|nr:metal ABC transporter permease [Pirellulimonas nuda]QDU89935.1 Manganese transport system membrane protein MntB [Pirellulimonas nuda]
MLEGWNSFDTRAVMLALATNVCCALVGTFLVLRRKSMVGDALSHAVLPGLAVAFLLSGSLGSGFMLLGAVGAGLTATLLTELAERRGGAIADAGLGVVFTSLFALGVLLIKRYISGVHFDIACVYEGSLLSAALDTVHSGPLQGMPTALLTSVPLALGVALLIGLFWKELMITSFDPVLASSMGVGAGLLNYALMGVVSLAAAVSFQTVGSVLVVAMLIIPAATAQFLSNRATRVLGIAVLLSALSTAAGYALSLAWRASPAGSMALAAGGVYAFVALAAPRRGVIAKLVASMSLAARVRGDDLLTRLYRDEEHPGPEGAPHALDWIDRFVRWRLVSQQSIARSAGGYALTPSGRERAGRIVRAHRLWESYLVGEVGLPADHVHEPAHAMEHFLDHGLRQEIEASLGAAATDPHGREIPKDSGAGD